MCSSVRVKKKHRWKEWVCPTKVGVVTFILLMNKPRPKEIKWLAQYHTAMKLHSRASSPGSQFWVLDPWKMLPVERSGPCFPLSTPTGQCWHHSKPSKSTLTLNLKSMLSWQRPARISFSSFLPPHSFSLLLLLLSSPFSEIFKIWGHAQWRPLDYEMFCLYLFTYFKYLSSPA